MLLDWSNVMVEFYWFVGIVFGGIEYVDVFYGVDIFVICCVWYI